MLPRFGVYLISEAFLESHLQSHTSVSAHLAHARGRFDRWSRQCRTLGPATPLRTLLEAGATPLFEALGFDGVSRIDGLDDRAVAAVVTAGQRALTLVVGPWGAPLEPLWRIAVTHAVLNGADWCF